MCLLVSLSLCLLVSLSVFVCTQSTSKRLPEEWGFQQFEVVTDKGVDARQAWWRVDDLKFVNITQGTVERNESKRTREEEEQAIRKRIEDMMDLANTKEEDDEEMGGRKLSFWEKYFEIQVRLLNSSGGIDIAMYMLSLLALATSSSMSYINSNGASSFIF